MGTVVPDPADRTDGDEGVDVDRPRAFEPDVLDLLILKENVVALALLVALDLILVLDRFARLGIHVLAQHPCLGFPVEVMEADLAAFRDGRRHGDPAGHERELQIALPECTRCHGISLHQCRGNEQTKKLVPAGTRNKQGRAGVFKPTKNGECHDRRTEADASPDRRKA